MRKIFYGSIAGLLALLAAAWLVHLSARFLVDRVLVCPAPCHWDRQKGYSGCSPLEAHLEIKTTPDPHGHGEAVWYRAVVKNNSCETIELDSDFFVNNRFDIPNRDDNTGVFVLVDDSEGMSLPVSNDLSSSPDVIGLGNEIHPYKPELSGLTPLMNKYVSRLVTVESIILRPGVAAVASPSVLAPFREVLRDVYTKDEVTTYNVPEPIGMKNPGKYYALPPPGFRRLTEYPILKSGTYTAQLRLNEKVTLNYFEGDGSPTQRGLWRSLYFLANPRSSTHIGRVQIDTVSEKIKFKVPR